MKPVFEAFPSFLACILDTLGVWIRLPEIYQVKRHTFFSKLARQQHTLYITAAASPAGLQITRLRFQGYTV